MTIMKSVRLEHSQHIACSCSLDEPVRCKQPATHFMVYNGSWVCEHHFQKENEMMFECSICYNAIPTTGRCKLSCDHLFCKFCVTRWRIDGNNTCPMCRSPIDDPYNLDALDVMAERRLRTGRLRTGCLRTPKSTSTHPQLRFQEFGVCHTFESAPSASTDRSSLLSFHSTDIDCSLRRYHL